MSDPRLITTQIIRRQPRRFLHLSEERKVRTGQMQERQATMVMPAVRPAEEPPRDLASAVVWVLMTVGTIGLVVSQCWM